MPPMEMMNILIVEDEFLVAVTLEDILISQGHDVVGIAADSARAAEVATNVDLAFVDLNLRDGLTGPDVAAKLAEKGARIVYVTANPAQIGVAPHGAVGYLEKPFGENAILATVDYVQSGGRLPPPSALVLLTT